MNPTRRGREIAVVAALIEDGEKVLVAKRRRGSGGGRWEFPGGKIETGESAPSALRREIAEELGVIISVEDSVPFADTSWSTGDTRFRLMAFRARIRHGVPAAIDHEEVRWVKRNSLPELDLLPADQLIARQLLSRDPG